MRQGKDDSDNRTRTKSVLYQADTSQYDDMSLIELLQAILDGADQHGLYRLALMKKTRKYTNRVAKPFLVQGSISQSDLDSLQFITLCEVLDSLNTDEQVPILQRFYSLLKWRLIANIIDDNDHESNISLPPNVRLYMRKYVKYTRMYEQTHNGTKPPEDVIAKALNMSIKQIRALQQAYRTQWPIALDTCIKADDEGGNDLTIADVLVDDEICVAELVTDKINQSELSTALQDALKCLPDAEKQAIVEKYFTKVPVTDKQALQRGMRLLSTPKTANNLYPYLYSESIKGTSVKRFNQTWSSSTERTAIQRM